MPHELNVNIASVASLFADPARATMLAALLDGRALPAGELAYAAGVTAQTASAHLSKLLDGGLVTVEREGRHRYYRLAGGHIAEALERLAAIRRQEPVRRKALSSKGKRLRFARCCYNHLAGELGVCVAQSLQHRGFLVAAPNKRFEITTFGATWFASVGVDIQTLTPSRRGLARQCLDWTERTHHVAGPLGVGLLEALCARGWMRRSKESRAIRVTPKGRVELKRQLGISVQALGDAHIG